MRTRTIPCLLALSSLLLAGCGGEAPIASTTDSPSTRKALSETVSPETVPSPEAPAAADIRVVDLGAAEWLYSAGGFDLPVAVKLAGGTATAEVDGLPVTYTLGEVSYGDVDADGDDDAVARIDRAQDMGFEGLWYVWLAEGETAVQLKYPIARTSRCGTYVESVVVGAGAVELTEYHRIPGLDDAIPCSDPGTGLKQRTIAVHAEAGEAWPVQTAPLPAWGGLCSGPKWPDSAPGLVSLLAAPADNAPVVAAPSPDGGAIFEQKDAPLTQRNGWALVGFRIFGVESDLGGADMSCAWARN